jgi:hypothetical protein
MPTCSDAKVRRILMLQIGQSAPTLKSASRNMPTCSDAKVRRILMLQIGQSAPTLKSASRAAAVREGPRTNYFIFHIRILGFYNLRQLLALDIYEGRLLRSNWTKTKTKKQKTKTRVPKNKSEADP